MVFEACCSTTYYFFVAGVTIFYTRLFVLLRLKGFDSLLFVGVCKTDTDCP